MTFGPAHVFAFERHESIVITYHMHMYIAAGMAPKLYHSLLPLSLEKSRGKRALKFRIQEHFFTMLILQ